MKRFIKGTFELDQNVTDLEAYEENHIIALSEIINWANDLNVYVAFGTADDNTYLCEFKMVGNTASLCRSLLSELKEMLKKEWKKPKSLWEASGNVLY